MKKKKGRPPKPKPPAELQTDAVSNEVDDKHLSGFTPLSLGEHIEFFEILPTGSTCGSTSDESASICSSSCSPLDWSRKRVDKGKTMIASSGLVTSTIGKTYFHRGQSKITQYGLWRQELKKPNLTNGASSSSKSDLRGHASHVVNNERTFADALKTPRPKQLSEETSSSEPCKEVLESLFAQRSGQQLERNTDRSTMVREMQSFRHTFHSPALDTTTKAPSLESSYEHCRHTADQYWASLKYYRNRAAIAHAAGDHQLASHLLEQGRRFTAKAREADAIASKEIFRLRNNCIENIITIDLHGQRIKEGLKYLKLHLLFGASVKSVKLFRVITGYGKHTQGKSVLKAAVINLLERENIKWSEENEGTLFIKLNDEQELNFLMSGNDSD